MIARDSEGRLAKYRISADGDVERVCWLMLDGAGQLRAVYGDVYPYHVLNFGPPPLGQPSKPLVQ